MALSEKVILVTGGTKGIGYGIAEALLEKGCRVAITGRSQATVDEAVNKLSKKYRTNILGLVADVRNLALQADAVTQVKTKWQRLDVVVANAGLGYFGPVETLTPEQWNETIDINLTGVFYSLKASWQELKLTEGYLLRLQVWLAQTSLKAEPPIMQVSLDWLGLHRLLCSICESMASKFQPLCLDRWQRSSTITHHPKKMRGKFNRKTLVNWWWICWK